MEKILDKNLKTYNMAMHYIKQGYSVIPLKNKDKKPDLESWKEYQTRLPTASEITDWFLESNNRNIGIVTGAISGIVVVDVDSREALRIATDKGIPTCPTVQTGKGYHFYFKYRDGVRNFQKRDDLPGIDLRGDGGYVVCPPSIHATGKEYIWEGFDRPLLELPSWVLSTKDKPKKPIIELYQGVTEGSRNDTLARLAGVWVRSLPLHEAIEMAYAWNSRNNPQMDSTELERTVKSIYSAMLRSSAEVDKDVTNSEYMSLKQLKDKIYELYKSGYRQGESTGWHKLDEFYKVRRGEWTLISGVPSHGKSSWIDALLINLVGDTGWNFGIFSAENLPLERHAAGLIENYIGKPFDRTKNGYMSTEELNQGYDMLSDRFIFIKPEENYCTVDRIIKITKELFKSRFLSAIIIDPWNEIDHTRPEGMTETEYISQCLSKIRRFAREYDIHVFLVAHPTKLLKDKNGNYPVPTPYDVSGSSHWRNKSDNCIAVWRDVLDESCKVQVHIQKIRFRENGKPGVCELWFDRRNGRYEEKPIY